MESPYLCELKGGARYKAAPWCRLGCRSSCVDSVGRMQIFPEDIDREKFELARHFLSASKFKTIPGHVAQRTNHAL